MSSTPSDLQYLLICDISVAATAVTFNNGTVVIVNVPAVGVVRSCNVTLAVTVFGFVTELNAFQTIGGAFVCQSLLF